MSKRQLVWLISIINSLLITSACLAQNTTESLLEDVLEDLSVNNEVEDTHWEDVLEELSSLKQDPLNLNTATQEQLQQFPFLSDIQIEYLLAYVYVHGQMRTIYELQLVEYMDKQTIDRLLPFVCVEVINNRDDFRWKTRLKKILKYGKHQMLTRIDIPFYRRKGYERTYLGPPVYNSVKYELHYRDNFYAGISAENDAGEPWGALHNRMGYDYYSFYLFLRGWGRLKALALGNYRMSFGQGLVISTDYLMGKTIYASMLNSQGKGIKKYSSTDEYNYFQGAAATFSFSRQWEASAFYSYREMDGAVENGEITSIYKTGLHRGQKEADKKHQFALQLAGGNISFRKKRIRLGVTGVYYFFDRPYEPDLSGYSKFNLRGNLFYNAGIDYSYHWQQLSFQGETAKGKEGWATVNRLQYAPWEECRFMVIQRFYSYNYWAMFAHSFGEGSAVQNENGYYLAAEVVLFSRWKLFASFDFFAFPWKKYRISKASQGMDGLAQVAFAPCRSVTMDWRYRYKQKDRDVSGSQGKITLPTFHHQLRYRLNYSWDEVLSSHTTLDYNHFHSQDRAANQGYQVTQMISYRLPWIRLFADIQGSYFYTSDYDSRVYIAERGLLYTFYTPLFQGKGFRCSFRLRYDLNDHWMCLAKFGETVYHDRDEIGSGNDLIYGNKKADMQVQVRFKF